jgi:hypothetical protein
MVIKTKKRMPRVGTPLGRRHSTNAWVIGP